MKLFIAPKTFLLSKIVFLFLIGFGVSAQVATDSVVINQLDEVLVSAIRVKNKAPISFSNLDKKDIKSRNLGQDIPILMQFLPSVVTTSDAGNGVGYTGIRVRGSDATRVNVTINGIPYNDAESQGTFWVNMPDFASSVQSLQLQRGVGTSTNGAAAFGASLNLLTDNFSQTATAEIANSVGSFNTQKNTVKFSTGLLNNQFEFAGRLSKIVSDGFVDRAKSDLKSYFLQGVLVNNKSLFKALVFGGTEKTYQSWNGIDAATLATDRTFNSAGIYTDALGNTSFYDNETDNYQQDHFQLHWSEKYNDNWSSNLAIHYTKGKGYYENFKEDAKLLSYGINPIVIANTTIAKTDLVRQKWLNNDFYGTTFSVNYLKENTDLVIGGGYNVYDGQHYGKVIWARFAGDSELGNRYYDNDSKKTDANFFTKLNYQLTSKLSLYGDLQLRNVDFKVNSPETGNVNDSFLFFNPKAGLNYGFNTANAVYFSFAKASREPNRVDYESGNTKPEFLNDLELGWRYNKPSLKINTNLYYMAYKDQLILTGNLDDVGNPIRSNSEKSYRFGLEVDAVFKINNQLSAQSNIAISQNKNIDLITNNTNIGTKDIAYSPSIIAGSMLNYSPIANLKLVWLSKFVGKQYLNNIELPDAKLNDYWVNDLNINYEIKTKKIFKTINISGLFNNFLNKKYISNGYMYDIYAYYYPQAGTNFLLGLNLGF